MDTCPPRACGEQGRHLIDPRRDRHQPFRAARSEVRAHRQVVGEGPPPRPCHPRLRAVVGEDTDQFGVQRGSADSTPMRSSNSRRRDSPVTNPTHDREVHQQQLPAAAGRSMMVVVRRPCSSPSNTCSITQVDSLAWIRDTDGSAHVEHPHLQEPGERAPPTESAPHPMGGSRPSFVAKDTGCACQAPGCPVEESRPQARARGSRGSSASGDTTAGREPASGHHRRQALLTGLGPEYSPTSGSASWVRRSRRTL